MLRPWVLALVAAVCAVLAVVYPSDPWASDIFVVEQADVSESIKVEIDGERVVVHALEGYTIQGWGQSTDPLVEIVMRNEEGRSVQVRVVAGGGPQTDEQVAERDGRAIRATALGRAAPAVVWEVVPGAAMVVDSRTETTEALVSIVQAVEVE